MDKRVAFGKKIATRGFAFIAAFAWASSSPAEPLTSAQADHSARFIGDQVQTDRLMERLRRLSGDLPIEGTTVLSNRSSEANKELVRRYIVNELTRMGYRIRYERFPGPNGRTGVNIIAEKAPIPNVPIVEMVAHYDSRNHSVPGADDNGTSVAANLETAENFKDRQVKKNIRFVFPDFEEAGLLGSKHHVKEILKAKEPIAMALNMDMLGYHPNNGRLYMDLVIGSDPTNKAHGGRALYQHARYSDRGTKLFPLTVGGNNRRSSDHGSYWDGKIPSIYFRENFEYFNPAYHTARDRVDLINVPYFNDNVRIINEVFADAVGATVPKTSPEYRSKVALYESVKKTDIPGSDKILAKSHPVANQILRLMRLARPRGVQHLINYARRFSEESTLLKNQFESDITKLEKKAQAAASMVDTAPQEKAFAGVQKDIEEFERKYDVSLRGHPVNGSCTIDAMKAILASP